MTPIEIIATIFAVIVLVKMVFLYYNPKPLFKLGRYLMKNNDTAKWVYLIGVLIVGKFLIDAMSIVEIAAVLLFASGLYGVTLMSYGKVIKNMHKEIEKNHFFQKAWAPVIIYIVIAVWTLWTLFGQ